jgi:2-oxoisovalerate dehydrogenase E1 component beta subunit
VWKALEAAEQLEREDGLSVEVLDLRTLAPLDVGGDRRHPSAKTNRVLVLHDDTRTGGIAGENHRRGSARAASSGWPRPCCA